jgi:hypothetical protein
MSTPADDSVVGPDSPREVAGLGRVPQREKRPPQRRPRDTRQRRPANRPGAGTPRPAGLEEARRESPAPPPEAPEEDPHALDTLA